MSMTYTPSWEKKYDPYDTEPEIWDSLELELELENAKVEDELSIEDLADEELQLDESEFDL